MSKFGSSLLEEFAGYRQVLGTYFWPLRKKAALLALLLLASISLQILNPLVLRHFIDTAVAGGSINTLVTAALLFIGIALIIQIVTVAETYYAEQIAWSATDALRADLAQHVLELDMGFHSMHVPGELLERVDGDVSTLANFFSRFIIYVTGNLLLLVGILAVVFSIHWVIGLTLCGFAAVSLLTLQQMRGFAVPRFQALRQVKAELFGFLEERFAGTEDIRANGATNYVLSQLFPFLRANLLRAREATIASGAGWTMTVMLFVGGTVLALMLGTHMFRNGVITIGTVYLIFNYTEQLRRPIEMISRHLQDLQQAAAGLHRIQELFSTTSTIIDGYDGAIRTDALSVEFANVDFAYKAGEPILRNISFSLASGQTLGLLGRTGSGKTTISRLLMRFYDPTAGSVRLGGIDIRKLSRSALRRSVGLVTQNVQLFDATLRDNLTFFDHRISYQTLMEVIDNLGLSEWYATLPNGLETRLKPDGLSAGQAQLLAMSRVFLIDPQLVILDEATARIDPLTQTFLERAMTRLLHERTAIIIAHRLETVEKVDEILVLEARQVIESGARTTLANDPSSLFHQMLQSGSEEMSA